MMMPMERKREGTGGGRNGLLEHYFHGRPTGWVGRTKKEYDFIRGIRPSENSNESNGGRPFRPLSIERSSPPFDSTHASDTRPIHKVLHESVLGIRVEPDEAILRLPKRGTPKMASLKPTA
eukprot:scaffold1110_cov239-Chaetoceros_neogracile.AAC.1